mmetsp:Transcript_9687/g.22052  ORF Transcript_9687/g.22052 Transcript_9687/m.22052 type:complete len:210 (-) Transcript_9687:1702-2331(-)|eukprot:711943-Hanusia_phi.AAC.3
MSEIPLVHVEPHLRRVEGDGDVTRSRAQEDVGAVDGERDLDFVQQRRVLHVGDPVVLREARGHDLRDVHIIDREGREREGLVLVGQEQGPHRRQDHRRIVDRHDRHVDPQTARQVLPGPEPVVVRALVALRDPVVPLEALILRHHQQKLVAPPPLRVVVESRRGWPGVLRKFGLVEDRLDGVVGRGDGGSPGKLASSVCVDAQRVPPVD